MRNYRPNGTARIVELSHYLHPGQEEYQLEVDNRYVEELLPEYERPPDAGRAQCLTEGGGPENQYLWRGKLIWQALTHRPQ